MTRHNDLELLHGVTPKVRDNAVKQDRVHATNAIGHHPERPGFLCRTEFIGGTAGGEASPDGDIAGAGAFPTGQRRAQPRADGNLSTRPLYDASQRVGQTCMLWGHEGTRL